MSERIHSLLSASNAHRWLVCTPSARLEERFPDNESEAAKEGTFAHELAQIYLECFTQKLTPDEYKARLKDLKAGKTDKGDYYNADMQEHVDTYTTLCTTKYFKACEHDKGAALFLEVRLDLHKWIPYGFGYADAVIIADGELEVIDFKYGKGVRVEVEDNPQLRLYALGACEEFNWLYDVHTVHMTICQPRNGGTHTATIPYDKLQAWGEKFVKPQAEKAYFGEGSTHAGAHCRFCRAAPRCQERSRVLLKFDHKDLRLIPDGLMLTLLEAADVAIEQANKVKEFALAEALKGKKFEGYKLVTGRSTSKITDANKAVEALHAMGYDDTKIYKPKELLSLTALKKLIGSKKFKGSALEAQVTRVEGKPTLVPESDPRPEYNSATADFKPLDA